jgi:hypothetical protein
MAVPPVRRRIYRHLPKRSFRDFRARQIGQSQYCIWYSIITATALKY